MAITAVVSNGNLLLELDDGTIINAGRVQGMTGATGPMGMEGPRGSDGRDGRDGRDGASIYTGFGTPESSAPQRRRPLHRRPNRRPQPVSKNRWRVGTHRRSEGVSLDPLARQVKTAQQVVAAPSSSTLAQTQAVKVLTSTTVATQSTKATSGSTPKRATSTSISAATGSLYLTVLRSSSATPHPTATTPATKTPPNSPAYPCRSR